MLTICLITQGRKEVQEFLERASSFEDLDFIDFLIIDNGGPIEQSSIIEAWSKKQPRTTYIKREHNSIDFNDFWPLIEEHGSEWINFPGDDDRLIRQSYIDWMVLVKKHNNLNAIAMSAKIINSEGKSTGETVEPNFSQDDPAAQQIALALQSPPFFWPSLVFKKSTLKPPFPRSRFVLDWAISLQLTASRGVMDSSISLLEYRRHADQESNQVSLNRKFFEAALYMDEFISGDTFASSLSLFQNEEKIALWDTSFQNRPIYGDSEFGNIVLFRLAKTIIASSNDQAIRNQIISDLALIFGTLFHDDSLSELMRSGDINDVAFGNVKISNIEMKCPYLYSLTKSFAGYPSSISIAISCKHDPRNSAAIYIGCENYAFLTHSQRLDRLVLEINSELERRGEMEFKISPRERQLLHFIRKIKPFLPKQLIMRARKSL